MKKSVAWLYTKNIIWKINKTIPFTIVPKTINYLGINLIKKVKDLYTENYKTSVKETEENTKKWKDILGSWIGKINFVKKSTLPKAIYRYKTIFIQIPMVMIHRRLLWPLCKSVSSVGHLCLTLCNPMECSTPGFPVHHQFLELVQTQVHQVGDAIQPSYPLPSVFPPAFNLSQHQVFFNESVLRIR